MAFWTGMTLGVGMWEDPDPIAGLASVQVHMGAPGKDGHAAGGETHGDLMVAEPITQTKRPAMYKVILLNDDYTPMDFVVMVLESVFRKDHDAALEIMLQVHQKGAGLCGVFTRDVAETKTAQVIEYARINDYPLQCTLEPEA